ncbi:hypothetical protein ES703_104866 [subsurface metagenome]
MPSVLARLILVVSGYFPLFLILTVRYFHEYKEWALVPTLIGVIALLGLVLFFNWTRASEPIPTTINDIQRRDSEVVTYLLTYIFPFLNVDISNIPAAASLGIFFTVLIILNVSANIVHINPMLNLAGFHIYKVRFDGKEEQTLLTRRPRLLEGTAVRLIFLSDEVYLEKK